MDKLAQAPGSDEQAARWREFHALANTLAAARGLPPEPWELWAA